MKTKVCTNCGEEKPVADFSFDRSRKQYKSHCKSCRAAKAKARRDQKRGYEIVEEVLPEGQKRCTKCKEILLATNDHFTTDKSKKDGLNLRCRKCKNEYERILYQRRIEKRRESKREYGRKNKDKQRKTKKNKEG